MTANGLNGDLVFHRDNGNVVFWVGTNLVVKASTGDARKELAFEASILRFLSLHQPVVQLAESIATTQSAGDWDVLFTVRLNALDSTPTRRQVLESLARLHDDLGRAELSIELSDWSDIPRSAERCRQANPFFGSEAEVMDKVFEQYVLPAMSKPHSRSVIHGDVDIDQAILTPDGIIWIDFETVCRGPVEWDLAAFENPHAYGSFDDELWNRLRIVHSWCVAAWCNRSDVQNDSRTAARNAHLRKLFSLYS